MIKKHFIRALTTLAAVLAASGCASRDHERALAFLRSHEASVSTGHYVVNPPDTIVIHARGADELDGTRQRVRPDGKVALRLLGEVYVAGMTTEQIAAKLKTQLERYYVNPEVVVAMADYGSQTYFVMGEVANPGPKIYTGRDTLLQALASAAPTFLAWRAQIRVVRPTTDGGEPSVMVVDLDRMVRDGGVEQNILLQPGDIIEVPPTPLAWVGHRVRELLYPVSPALNAYTGPAAAIRATDVYRGDDEVVVRRR